ncbi:rhomboid family intramembrane serine protease [Akkermansiaceae bacterium]|nr:rhomboid family intramembrane serine protease [Akkermansiaceae bacterium]
MSEEPEEEWVDVGKYSSLDEAHEHALVALAMGEAIRVEHGDEPGGYDVRAEPSAAPKVSEELKAYEEESRTGEALPLLPSNWGAHPAGALHFLVWAATLLLVFRSQSIDPTISDRFASSSRALIGNGEWWRPFTALFLHGDGPHIAGNLASGAVFGMLVSKSLGPWKGWSMILLAGTAGNAITSWILWPVDFRSLGASTAVFGALGILSGIGIVENSREKIRMPWLRVIAPLLAGFVLLGWLGGAAPGEGVDVFGHVFGFCAGVLAGVICRWGG